MQCNFIPFIDTKIRIKNTSRITYAQLCERFAIEEDCILKCVFSISDYPVIPDFSSFEKIYKEDLDWCVKKTTQEVVIEVKLELNLY